MTADSSLNKVVAVVGPTATGKTRAGVLVTKQLGSEVISADSQLVYRDLTIGTAKPTLEEQDGIPHHMIDVTGPEKLYSVSQYQEAAEKIRETLTGQGKVPVVVGGTGFYIRALLEEALGQDVPVDEEFRQELKALANEKGVAHLHSLLTEKDPDRASKLYSTDAFRIIRALEIIRYTGKPVPPNQPRTDLDVTWIGLTYSNRDLHRQVIEDRVTAMMSAGWEEEVRSLLETYGPEAEALQKAHGYPELVQYIQGKLNYKETIQQICLNVQQYSKRQMTWFKRNQSVRWWQVDDVPGERLERELISTVQGIL
ncbi:MAG: tRNA (adenosine(37)-N6)-dimethylallyltransferase MiaA [Vampirovibrio sp.]|nr:tRNA (adenosine(37)-N6)-dimethylallyltransferase MiaA [Vampirovibrio sp.]